MNNCVIQTINYSHLFLCGHLNTDKTSEYFLLENKRGWVKEEVDEKLEKNDDGTCTKFKPGDITYQDLCNMYYESFVDSLVSVKDRVTSAPYNNTAHYVLDINKKCKLHSGRLSNGVWNFTVLKLHLFFFPYKICLFAIEIEGQENSVANDLTFAHFCLREVNNYVGWVEKDGPNNTKYKKWQVKLNAPEYLETIEPLIELCPCYDKYENKYSVLTLTGNKLKVFQIILSDNTKEDFLFELGSLISIGCVSHYDNFNSPSEEYYNKLMSENKISVYRNWKALALFDTFTVLFDSCDKSVLYPWTNYYFRLIYIHSLFQKTMLFVVNKKFRSGEQTEECQILLHDMKEQEHWYAFSNISYNFLPQLIYKFIDNGLEICDERESLRKYIEQESERQDKQNEFWIGKLVFYITLITILSALYDGSSLLKELFGICTGSLNHFRIVIVLILIIIYGGLTIYNKYKK